MCKCTFFEVNFNSDLLLDIPGNIPNSSPKEPGTPDEINDKTEISNTPKVDISESNSDKSELNSDKSEPNSDKSEPDSDKIVTEEEKKEEVAESSPDIQRIPTPEDTSELEDKSDQVSVSTDVKVEVSDTKNKAPIDEPSKSSSSDSEDNLIEVEDGDDYLLHLEAILKTIHTRFYTYYKEHGKVKDLLNGID